MKVHTTDERGIQTTEGNKPLSTPHVVIIGGGFGGLETAKALGKQAVQVTVIDSNNFHLFQLLFLIGTRNRLIVFFQYAWAYFTFQRGARVILPGGTDRSPT